MSLRARLFLMVSGLVLLLVAVQWWWVRRLTQDLTAEVGLVAMWVGDSVAAAVLDDARHHDIEVDAFHTSCEGDGCAELEVEQVTDDLRRNDDGVWVHERVLVRRKEIETLPERADFDDTGAQTDQLRREILPWAEEDVDWMSQRKVMIRIDADGPDSETEAHIRHLVLRSPTGTAAPHRIHQIPIPESGVRDQIDRFSRQLLLASGGLLAFGLLLAGFLAHRVSSPLRQLAGAAEQVGDGALGTRVEVAHPDRDVGRAVAAFNQMSERLDHLDRHNRTLAARQHLGEIGEIARGLAHTLRNPLNALGLSLETLAERAPEAEDNQDLVAAARRQIRRIDDSVRSFLTLASDGGSVENVEVDGLAREVTLAALQDAARTVQVRVVAERTPTLLRAVAPELRAVLQALVVNAVEASEDGGEVVVRVTGPDEDGGVGVDVEDRGHGVDPGIRARLFEPHRSTKAHGSGMGLFLAHRIASTRYAGDLHLDDRTDGGTRASLRLGPRHTEPTETNHER